MSWLHQVALWLRSLFHKDREEQELDAELRFHLEEQIALNIARGMTPQGARRAALRTFGGVEQAKEDSRDVRGTRFLEDFVQDVRYGVRVLGRAPGFVFVAVLSLALGIGANTAIFRLINALILQPLPFTHPEQLLRLESTHPLRGATSIGSDDFRDWQAQSTSFEQMAYTSFTQANLTGQSFPGFGEPERVTGTEVSAGFFPVLGTQPLMGRWLLPEEEAEGHNRVIILSYGFWQRRFGARPDIVGQALILNGRSYIVVGVMPRDFRFNEGYLCEYWMPMQHRSTGRQSHQYGAYARLKPGRTLATAQTELSTIAKRLERAYPATNTGWGVRATRLDAERKSDFGPALLMFSVAVGVVLLIGCANVANLLLARATARRREVAVRLALGATRKRLVRQLLTESLLLAGMGAALGFVLAEWGTGLAVAAAPEWLELNALLRIDGNVLGFMLLVSVLAGVLTGLVPALQATRASIQENLKEGGGTNTGPGPSRALNAFVVTEVALAALLLVSAGLLTKSFIGLMQINLGFRTENVLIARMQLPSARYPEAYQRVEFWRNLVESTQILPGVISAGAASDVPLGSTYSGGPVQIEGQPLPMDWEQQTAAYSVVTPDYFRTLEIPLRTGRYFTDRDTDKSEPVIIVNEALANRFSLGRDPIGKKIKAGGQVWKTIVGVVGDVRRRGPAYPPRRETFSPLAQNPSREMFLIVRTASATSAVAGAVREEIRALNRELPVMQLHTMQQSRSEAVAMPRQLMSLVGIFAGVGMVLAALGLAGVMWYSVSRRTHEIGVRLALGARPSEVLRLVLRRALTLTLAGLAIGLVAAVGLTRLLGSLLYGVAPDDPAVFAIAGAVLTAVALAASYLPAWRASRVNPLVALRYE